MMSTADRLVLRVRGNPATLDALAQWAMTPVNGVTSYPPDHTLIIGNLMRRFGIPREQAVERFADLQDAIAAVGLDPAFGFLAVRDDLRARLLADGTLPSAVSDRILAAPLRERRIGWLFCRTGPADGDVSAVLPRFLALLRATFDMSATASEVTETLLRLGCVNELEATIEDYPHVIKRRVLVASPYAGAVPARVEGGIDLPRRPDFRPYLERRISRRMLSELIALDEILDGGVDRTADLSGDVTPERGVIEEREGAVAASALIAEEAREMLLAAKERLADDGTGAIEAALEAVYEQNYPSLSVQRRDLARGVAAWELALADGRELVVVHAPWLTGRQLRQVAGMARTKGVVLVCSGLMGIPETERLMQRLSLPGEEGDLSLVLSDIRPGRRAVRVHGTRPALADEVIAATEASWIPPKEPNAAPQRPAVPLPEEPAEESYEAPAALYEESAEESYETPAALYEESAEESYEAPAALYEEPVVEPAPFPEAPASACDADPVERYTVSYDPLRQGGLHVFLGTTGRGDEVHWSPGDLLNGHCIIIGGSGAGKTETIRCVSSELERQGYPVLLIDFHGDMASSNGFARTYEIREGGAHYFNPLDLDRAFSEITPLRATSDFVDAIFINFPTLGIQQREHLVEIISDCYARANITSEMRTWERELKFADIREAITSSDDKTTQTIRAYMGDIFRYNLFQSTEKISISRMLDGGITHLNLRALPESLRSLYADLILRKLYYSVQSLGEIPRGEVGDHDRFRIFVIVDEAKLLVGEKQGIKAVLNKYATELRKFGVGIILASQLVGHFNDEILANIAVKFCMKAETKRQARENCKYFEFDERQLLTLGQGEGILVSGDDRRKIRIVPSWERDGDDA